MNLWRVSASRLTQNTRSPWHCIMRVLLQPEHLSVPNIAAHMSIPFVASMYCNCDAVWPLCSLTWRLQISCCIRWVGDSEPNWEIWVLPVMWTAMHTQTLAAKVAWLLNYSSRQITRRHPILQLWTYGDYVTWSYLWWSSSIAHEFHNFSKLLQIHVAKAAWITLACFVVGVITYQLLIGKVPWPSELRHSLNFNQDNGMKALKHEIRLFEEQNPSERKLACQFMRGCLQVYAKDRLKLSALLSHKWFDDTLSITTDAIPIPDGFMVSKPCMWAATVWLLYVLVPDNLILQEDSASKTPAVLEHRYQARTAGKRDLPKVCSWM